MASNVGGHWFFTEIYLVSNHLAMSEHVFGGVYTYTDTYIYVYLFPMYTSKLWPFYLILNCNMSWFFSMKKPVKSMGWGMFLIPLKTSDIKVVSSHDMIFHEKISLVSLTGFFIYIIYIMYIYILYIIYIYIYNTYIYIYI